MKTVHSQEIRAAGAGHADPSHRYWAIRKTGMARPTGVVQGRRHSPLGHLGALAPRLSPVLCQEGYGVEKDVGVAVRERVEGPCSVLVGLGYRSFPDAWLSRQTFTWRSRAGPGGGRVVPIKNNHFGSAHAEFVRSRP